MNSQYEKVVDFYNQTTNEQQLYFLKLMSDKISFWQDKKTQIKHYKIKDAFNDINLNGIYIDIHLTKD